MGDLVHSTYHAHSHKKKKCFDYFLSTSGDIQTLRLKRERKQQIDLEKSNCLKEENISMTWLGANIGYRVDLVVNITRSQ